MIGICAPDSVHNRQYWGFILLVAPVLEIVPKIPDDVGRVPVAVAEKRAVLLATSGSVLDGRFSPSALV